MGDVFEFALITSNGCDFMLSLGIGAKDLQSTWGLSKINSFYYFTFRTVIICILM